ncbi:hypothetical protein M3Y99_00539700 [Aphelenchoides fujianensis]|nr:hypothetical protein M3Y99_00539700 [Aphelenchoides fujianensis]
MKTSDSAAKRAAAFERFAYAAIGTSLLTVTLLFCSTTLLLRRTADVERTAAFKMANFRSLSNSIWSEILDARGRVRVPRQAPANFLTSVVSKCSKCAALRCPTGLPGNMGLPDESLLPFSSYPCGCFT